MPNTGRKSWEVAGAAWDEGVISADLTEAAKLCLRPMVVTAM